MHSENCLLYEQGNIDEALHMIELVCSDHNLRSQIIKNGVRTAEQRNWVSIEQEILKLYGFQTTKGEDYAKI